MNRKTSSSVGSGVRTGSPVPGRRRVGAFRAGVFATVIVLAMAATGCGSSAAPQGSGDSIGDRSGSAAAQDTTSLERKNSTLETVQVAYRNTTSQDTARVATTIDVSGMPTAPTASTEPGSAPGEEPSELQMTAQGVVDFAEGSFALTMQTPYLGQIESRQLGDVLYQRYPPELQEQMPGGKPWMKVDLNAISQEQYGMSASELGSASQSDPTQQLGYLKSVSDSVEKVGEEAVRGVATTHYRATVDLGEAAEQDPQTAQTRRAYDEFVEQLGTDELPVEVWLDGEGQVRRYEMSTPLILPEDSSMPEAQEADGRVSIVQELYDFGTPVNVETPPAAQTADISEMIAEETPN